MIFSQLEYRYQEVVFQLLKQIMPLLRQITLPAAHMQIGRFFYRTDKTRFSKASVTLSVTGFAGIASTGLPCFSFAPRGFFCTADLFFAFSVNESDSFFIDFYFLTALPFFLFSMFFMFNGVLSVFCFTVVLFFSVCMF